MLNRWPMFVLLFVTLTVVFFFVIPRSVMADLRMWSEQMTFVRTHDQQALSFYAAYGHPGTTLVEGGLLIRWLFGVSDMTALITVLSVLTAAFATIVVALARTLRPQSWWWLGTLVVVTINRMYYTTPPSMLILPVVAVLVLMTWQALERRSRNWRPAVVWGMVAGFSAATRFDITLLLVPLLLAVLWRSSGWKWTLTAMGVGAVALFTFDPFFWIMPIQHAVDLVRKFQIHYTDFRLPGGYLFGFATLDYYIWPGLAILGSLWAMRHDHERHAAPRELLFVLYAATVIVTVVVLSSSYQSIRYFLPLMYLWNLLLPLYLGVFSPSYLAGRYAQRHSRQRLVCLLRVSYWCLTAGWLVMTAFLLWYGAKPQ